jgi:hypothetical protein
MRAPRRCILVLALLCRLGDGGAAGAQESQDTFFDQEAFNSCAGFLAARARRDDGVAFGRYAAWADGYLTAAAEDGRLRRYASRTGTEARAIAWLATFCNDRPLESFYAAVVALADAWRRKPAP